LNEYRDSSNRLTFDFSNIDAGKYGKITKSVVSEFGLEASGTKTKGLDEVFQDFKHGNYIVGLEWDNWSGYIVNAKTVLAEPLTRKIAEYINANFNS
jgi:hypothetical protein